MKKAISLLGICAFSAATLFFMTGCATVFSKSKYDVQICSDRPGDRVVLKQGYETIADSETPYTMNLRASHDLFKAEEYTLEYVYPRTGYKEVAYYKARMDPWVIGSVILTFSIGLFVDAASGAMYKLPDQLYICTNNSQYGVNEESPVQKNIPEVKNISVAKEMEMKIAPDQDEDSEAALENEFAAN